MQKTRWHSVVSGGVRLNLLALAIFILFASAYASEEPIPVCPGALAHACSGHITSPAQTSPVQTRASATASASVHPAGKQKILPTRPSPGAGGIGCAKFLPDGSVIRISQKIVTVVDTDRFYVQEVDRSSGIRATTPGIPTQVEPGDVVSFTGVLETVNGERQLRITGQIDVHYRGAPLPDPLGMKHKFLVGGPLNSRTPGLSNSIEVNNVGLRVQIWGIVMTDGFVDESGAWCFYIDDGSRIRDGTYHESPQVPHIGVRVYSDYLPQVGEFRIVRGVCSMHLWDPTPANPESGDEFLIPVVRSGQGEVLYTGTPGPPPPTGTVTGTIRLVGAQGPANVRIYGTTCSAFVSDAGDTPKPFVLNAVLNSGQLITASAPGWRSKSIVVYGGETGVQIELEPSETLAGIWIDKTSIKPCSSETATVEALLRDEEGKPLANRYIKLKTSKGIFLPYDSNEVVLHSEEDGYVSVILGTQGAGHGIAQLTASDYPAESVTASASILFRGPQMTLSAEPIVVNSSGTSVLTASLMDGTTPIADAQLVFTTDQGGFDEAGGAAECTAVTGPLGTATATLRLQSPGTARVLVRYSDPCDNETIAWCVVARRGAAWYPVGTRFSSPLIENLLNLPDGSRQVAIVTSDRRLVVLRENGTLAWEKDARSDGDNTPSCADIDADPTNGLEVVLPMEEQLKVWAYAGATGVPLAGWPTTSNFTFKSVAACLADVNVDGALEVLAGDESCYVFSWNSTGDWEGTGDPADSFLWRNLTGSVGTAIYASTIAVGDINSDGIPDAMVGTNHEPEVYSFPGDAWGDHVNPPLYTPSWPRSSESSAESSPAIGDIDGDGKNDAAIGSSSGKLFIYTSSDGAWRGYPTGSSIRSSPALADLNGDGKLDVIFGSDNGRLYAVNYAGQDLPGWEGGIFLSQQTQAMIQSSPAVADINDDGRPEVVVGCTDGFIYAVYPDGVQHLDQTGRPTGPLLWARCAIPAGFSSAEVLSSPAIDDLDNDGKIDIVVGSTGGIFRFELDSTLVRDQAHMPWPTFHHDNARTGFAGTPPPLRYASIVGRVTKDGVPVTHAQVYISFADDSCVPVPGFPQSCRSYVLTVGDGLPEQTNRGAYSINQLEPGLEYKIKVVSTGNPDKIVGPFTATVGLNRIDIAL